MSLAATSLCGPRLAHRQLFPPALIAGLCRLGQRGAFDVFPCNKTGSCCWCHHFTLVVRIFSGSLEVGRGSVWVNGFGQFPVRRSTR